MKARYHTYFCLIRLSRRPILMHLVVFAKGINTWHGVCSDLVSVVMPDPCLRVWKALLIAALGNQVEVLIGGIHHVNAARKAGIGMKHCAALVPIERANPLTVQGARVRSRIVVERRSFVSFFRGK